MLFSLLFFFFLRNFFWGTFMCNETAVSQPGAWEVSTGFPTAHGSCLSRCYGCRLFSQWASERSVRKMCVCVCVCGESWVLLWGGKSKNKQALARRRGERDTGREPLPPTLLGLPQSFACADTHTIYSSIQRGGWINSSVVGRQGVKEFWETEVGVKINMHRTKAGKPKQTTKSCKSRK